MQRKLRITAPVYREYLMGHWFCISSVTQTGLHWRLEDLSREMTGRFRQAFARCTQQARPDYLAWYVDYLRPQGCTVSYLK